MDVKLSALLRKGEKVDYENAMEYKKAEDAYDEAQNLLEAKYPGEDDTGWPNWLDKTTPEEEANLSALHKAWRAKADNWKHSQEYEQARDERYYIAKSGKTMTAQDQYKALEGEAEARNVQKRQKMTMEERINLTPWQTLDVREKDLVSRGATSGVVRSADEAAITEVQKAGENFLKIDDIKNKAKTAGDFLRRRVKRGYKDSQKAQMLAKIVEPMLTSRS